MKITPVQSCAISQKNVNSKNASFKSAAINTLVKEAKIPNNFADYRNVLIDFVRTMEKEPTLRVQNQEIYDSLTKKFIRNGAVYIIVFFVKNSIEQEPNSYRVAVASDADGDLLSLGKDEDGQFLEFNTNDGYRRFGLTYPSGNYRYSFYKAPDVYIDYHKNENDNGCVRQMRTKAFGGWSTVWCDENGYSSVLSNAKGMWEDFKNIFRQ